MSDSAHVMVEDIRKASTLPSRFYTDADLFQQIKQKVFAPSWQFAADLDCVKIPGQIYPFTLLEGCLDEPLMFTRDSTDQLHCLSNVCTHRGNLVVEGACVEKSLRCRYHGRKFALDGRFQSMPEFQEAENFPSEQDNLHKVQFGNWGKLLFVSLSPQYPMQEWLEEINNRIGWMPLDTLALDATRSKDYLVRANWALYCDNYLEGFHIPFVHSSLNAMLDYGSYRTELFRYSNLQLGVSSGGEDVFQLPADSPDFGKDIAAYYFWLFPNTMMNVYPWGISINVIRPLDVDLTKVSFITYVWDSTRLDRGAGAALDRVEREDEAVVEGVHKGLKSRFYDRGRYSPTREQGVHQFHCLLAEALA